MKDDGVWLKPVEISNLLLCPKNRITRNIDEYEYRIVHSNGGKTFLINLQSLPPEAQLKYYKKIEPQEEPKQEANLVRFAPQSYISNKEANTKFQLVKLFNEFTAQAQSKVKAGDEFVQNFNNGSYPNLKNIVGEISVKSVYRWKKRLEDNNYNIDCLEPKYKPIGCSSVTREEAEILIDKALHENKKLISEIISQSKRIFKEKGFFIKSDSTYRRFIDDWASQNRDIWILAREGGKAFNDKVLKDIRRDKDKIEVGDILVADGHKFNATVINPLTGKATRMTLILFYDFKSDMPLGYEIMPTENTLAIAGALRNSILKLGPFFGAEGYVPKLVYLDNGRAFRGSYFTGTKSFADSEIPGLFGRLGIETTFATPYHGQAKPIERWFRTLSEMERDLPSYTGYNIANQPVSMKRNEKFHQRLFNNRPITLEEIHYSFESFVVEYANEPHVGGTYKGYTPREIFTNSVEKKIRENNYIERKIAKKDLIFLMLQDETRKIGNNGIKFRNEYYYNQCLAPLIGEKAYIKYDIWDKSQVFVFSENDKFICVASLDDEKFNPSVKMFGEPGEKERLSDKINEIKTYEKSVKEELKFFVTRNEAPKEDKKEPKQPQKKETKKNNKLNIFVSVPGYMEPGADPIELLKNQQVV